MVSAHASPALLYQFCDFFRLLWFEVSQQLPYDLWIWKEAIFLNHGGEVFLEPSEQSSPLGYMILFGVFVYVTFEWSPHSPYDY